MRFPLMFALVLLAINGAVDFTVYRAIIHYYGKGWLSKLQFITSILLAVFVAVIICAPKRQGGDEQLVLVMWGLYAYLSVYIPKYLYLIFYVLSLLPRIIRRRPLHAVSIVGAVVGVIVFVLMWWGALVNRYKIKVESVDVPVEALPSAFDGYRIAQISDLHVGTFGNDTTFVRKLVDSINVLNPDIVVFTGDIVNRHSQELTPFLQTLSHIKPPVYSIMGNHDYGDYSDWPDAAAKADDVTRLKDMQKSMGWHMLNNATTWLKAGSDSIALIGVENIGDPPFKIYGDLHVAYPSLSDSNVKILLSHNPAHWESDIEGKKDANVALTLSGHTHAMQIELFGWSPASMRYDKWGGMYTDALGHNLYVNIGAGEVGMPYRIGANPEITLFTLTSPKK